MCCRGDGRSSKKKVVPCVVGKTVDSDEDGEVEEVRRGDVWKR